MSLRRLAESDAGRILESVSGGFGWPITLIDPDGNSVGFTGFSNDISMVIDPDTGVAISGRSASVALRIISIYKAGYSELPSGIADSAKKPWLVRFDDLNGCSYTFKITTSSPDRSLGVLVCNLEHYKE